MRAVRTAVLALAITGALGTAGTAFAADAPPTLTSTGAGTSPQQVTLPGAGLVQLVSTEGEPTTALDIDAVGSYHVVAGTLVFQPALGFTGAHGVRYRVTDATGLSSDSTYTPSVVLPPPPSAPGLSTSGAYGQQQQCLVLVPQQGSVVLIDGTGAPSLDEVHQAGELTAEPAAGVVAFSPTAGFTGTETARYRVTDAYGQAADGTCTMTVNSVPQPLAAQPPTASRLRTRGAARRQQVAHLSVPAGTTASLVRAGSPTLHVYRPGQGSYALDPAAGTITFTPAAGFHGVGSVTYQVADVYGRNAQNAYTPTVLSASQPHRARHLG